MGYVRNFAGLTTDQIETLASIFRNDGATVEVLDDEGAFRISVSYPEPWATTSSSAATVTSALEGETVGWQGLIDLYKSHLGYTLPQKVATLSQWILESGRGRSELATRHINYAGLKFRERMRGFAEPVDYNASDGLDTYCKFSSPAAFITGYWRFIESGPYDGYEAFRDDSAGYIRHIAPKFAADQAYIEKVFGLFDEAKGLLNSSGAGGAASFTDASMQMKLAVVVGHNSRSPGAYAVSPIGQSEFDFNNTVADSMIAEASHYNLEVKRFNRVASGSYSGEIADVYGLVKRWGADAAIELHFNSLNSESTGTEALHAANAAQGRSLAIKLVGTMSDVLALKIRHGDGLKPCISTDRGYASLVAIPTTPTVLVEPFFGSNRNDCIKAAAVGPAGLARAYLRGVRDWAVTTVS
ncbi:hypothetical protein HFN97_16135 [Rhizobium laguerreae]|uniref:N-acetylmuramoyl-L-alanine amidase n=1 Tax=Rhizobium laguerreae TaxID=1076926 RepID=UPI001C91F93F|nr:N-acetylmuramoyl-L-alanine amidase [Rhizobium laguerreae]MBY3359361.1 hypothetical protein [Rhizobium laguerreae]